MRVLHIQERTFLLRRPRNRTEYGIVVWYLWSFLANSLAWLHEVQETEMGLECVTVSGCSFFGGFCRRRRGVLRFAVCKDAQWPAAFAFSPLPFQPIRVLRITQPCLSLAHRQSSVAEQRAVSVVVFYRWPKKEANGRSMLGNLMSPSLTKRRGVLSWVPAVCRNAYLLPTWIL